MGVLVMTFLRLLSLSFPLIVSSPLAPVSVRFHLSCLSGMVSSGLVWSGLSCPVWSGLVWSGLVCLVLSLSLSLSHSQSPLPLPLSLSLSFVLSLSGSLRVIRGLGGGAVQIP